MNYVIEVVETAREFDFAIREIEKCSVIATDTETVGFESKRLFSSASLCEPGKAVCELRYQRLKEIYDRCYKGKRLIGDKKNRVQWDEELALTSKARFFLDQAEKKVRKAQGKIDSFLKAARDSKSGLHFWENELGAIQIGIKQNDTIKAFILRPLSVNPQKLFEIFDSCETLLLHSCQFDWKMFRQHLNFELSCKNLWDTQIAEYVLLNGKETVTINGVEHVVKRKTKKKEEDSGLMKSLGDVAKRRLGIELDKSKDLRVSDWSGPWSDRMIQYAALDVVIPFGVYEQQLSEFTGEDKLQQVFRRECELVPHVGRMEMEGIGIDIEQARKLLAEKMPLRDHWLYQCGEALGVDSATAQAIVNSPKQLKEAFTTLGFELEDTNEKTLVSLEDCPFVDSLLEYREVNKIITTYIEPFLQKSVPIRHMVPVGNTFPIAWFNFSSKQWETNYPYFRLYGEFKQCFTETGRFSSENPNLQNLPATPEFRGIVIPRPGYVLINGDLSSIEPRILTHITQDPILLKAFKDGKDPYKLMATLLLGVAYEDVTKDQRKQMKPMLLAAMYGKTAWGLAKDLNIDTEAARRLLTKFFNTHLLVKRWVDKTLADARVNGYTETIDGRRRYLPHINSEDKHLRKHAENQALNTPIQGAAAAFMKDSIRILSTRLQEPNHKDMKLILTVHDELMIEVPDEPEMVALGKALLKEALVDGTSRWIPSVPVQVGSEDSNFEPIVIRNWGEAKAA